MTERTREGRSRRGLIPRGGCFRADIQHGEKSPDLDPAQRSHHTANWKGCELCADRIRAPKCASEGRAHLRSPLVILLGFQTVNGNAKKYP